MDSITQEGFALLKTKWILLTIGASLLLGCPTGALAQKKSSGEVRLVGIKLYDTGIHVVSVFGSPDSIEPINVGGGNAGSGTGARGPAAGGGGAGPQGPSSGGAGVGAGAAGAAPGPGSGSAWTDPSNFGNEVLRQMVSKKGGNNNNRAGGGQNGPGPGGSGAPPTNNGTTSNSGGAAVDVQFTRWVYHRGGSRYGFVIDRYNRVVQIEAVGLGNPKVRTARGITFGANFASIIKKYGAPEGYEISGDTVVLRYLVTNKVAFRLSRLGENKPQVVTGIAVAAGKA